MDEELEPLTIPPLGSSKKHDQILLAPAREVRREELLEPEMKRFITLMKRTLDGQGVGLAAPQVGRPLRIAVVEDRETFIAKWPDSWVDAFERRSFSLRVVVNPKLTSVGAEYRAWYEACLSKPQEPMFGKVRRHLAVRVEAMNEHGDAIAPYEVRGWAARIYQHECDHLDGVLCMSKFEPGSEITTEAFKALKQKPLRKEDYS